MDLNPGLAQLGIALDYLLQSWIGWMETSENIIVLSSLVILAVDPFIQEVGSILRHRYVQQAVSAIENHVLVRTISFHQNIILESVYALE